MITKKQIEKIEGEAELFLEKKGSTVEFATICFESFRGFSTILKGKNPLDALVYTPRVCGICGHSHLYATVLALEDAYRNGGLEVKLSQKAKTIREVTLLLEIVQNHIKWVYFVLMPELNTATNKPQQNNHLQGAYLASLLSKITALFSGQYPHSSYMLPGGITSDITHIELFKALSMLKEGVLFLEKEFYGIATNELLEFSTCKDFNLLESPLGNIENQLIQLAMQKKGFGYDRFLTLAEHSFNTPAKIKKTVRQVANIKYVQTKDSHSPQKKSFALNALYKDEYIEVGPLARAMSNGYGVIKNIHRRYKDSTYSRVLARIYEIPHLLVHIEKLIQSIEIEQTNYNAVDSAKKLTAKGVGIVEAPRGSLIHSIDIQNGKIANYSIITPTQFNLASGEKSFPSSSQKALAGLKENELSLVFRSFDVCSVCTTH